MTPNVHRAYVERLAREVLLAAEHRGATARETRRMLRARLASLTVSRSLWYAAAVRVAGCRLLDLADFRQPTLPDLDRGPRRTRPRRKKKMHAAA